MFGVVVGKVGRVEEKDVNGTFLLSFSVAERKYIKKKEHTTWYQISYWGKRAEGLAPHIFKGQSISVSGQSYLEEYDGKYYLKMDADNVIPQEWDSSNKQQDDQNSRNNSYSNNNSGNNHYSGNPGYQGNNTPGPRSHNAFDDMEENQFDDDIPL